MSRIIKSSRLIMRDFVQLALVSPEPFPLLPVNEAPERETMLEEEAGFDAEKAQALLEETEAMARDVLDKAHRQAQEIIITAKSEAEQLKQVAQTEGIQLKTKSREDGYKNGQEQAWKETEQERKALIMRAEAVLAEAHRAKAAMLAEIEPQLIQLVLALAQKVVCRELTVNPETIRDIAREALARAKGTGEMVLKVHESFYAPFNEGLEGLAPSKDGYQPFRVEIDNSVEPGGCLVDSGAGYVDAQISSQMEKIAKDFKQVKQHD